MEETSHFPHVKHAQVAPQQVPREMHGRVTEDIDAIEPVTFPSRPELV
jgi:hypothetical protein